MTIGSPLVRRLRRRFEAAAILACIACSAHAVDARASSDCADPAKALGVSRVIEIDASGGPMFGSATKRQKEPRFLAPDEVVLTFDDGPVPWVTQPILDTLDEFCTKATFFSVGEMALTYPAMTKEVLARGHTVGTHTWSHPGSLKRLSVEKAKDEIERGFAAVALAAGPGNTIAPFFRFPGLNDSDELLSYLQSRAIASFTVDVITNDSFIGSPSRIADRALKLVTGRGGILLFHDLKRPTAKALPAILAGLKAQGFKVVHLTAKAPVVPLAILDAELQPVLAKAASRDTIPFHGPIPEPKTAEGSAPALSELAPPARLRISEPPAAAGDRQAASQPLRRHAAGMRHRRGARRRTTAALAP
jgi:peptidoglycan/xylan/chitin deacetylase (PgdA/CDA1 family)